MLNLPKKMQKHCIFWLNFL